MKKTAAKSAEKLAKAGASKVKTAASFSKTVVKKTVTAKTQTARPAPTTKVKPKAKLNERVGKLNLSRRPSGKATVLAKAPAKPLAPAQTLRVAPPLVPETPKRQVSSAVLRAFEHAVRVFNRRRYEDALPLFENLLDRFPQEVEIVARANTYRQICHQKLEHRSPSPRSADELYDRGVVALNIGDFSQAKSFFEKALRLRPDEPHLLYSLAVTHAQSGAHEKALDYLGRSIRIHPRFRAQALEDTDLSGLRENKRFLELLGLTSPFEILEARR